MRSIHWVTVLIQLIPAMIGLVVGSVECRALWKDRLPSWLIVNGFIILTDSIGLMILYCIVSFHSQPFFNNVVTDYALYTVDVAICVSGWYVLYTDETNRESLQSTAMVVLILKNILLVISSVYLIPKPPTSTLCCSYRRR